MTSTRSISKSCLISYYWWLINTADSNFDLICSVLVFGTFSRNLFTLGTTIFRSNSFRSVTGTYEYTYSLYSSQIIGILKCLEYRRIYSYSSIIPIPFTRKPRTERYVCEAFRRRLRLINVLFTLPGGYGYIYLAQDNDTGREFALKVWNFSWLHYQ